MEYITLQFVDTLMIEHHQRSSVCPLPTSFTISLRFPAFQATPGEKTLTFAVARNVSSLNLCICSIICKVKKGGELSNLSRPLLQLANLLHYSGQEALYTTRSGDLVAGQWLDRFPWKMALCLYSHVTPRWECSRRVWRSVICMNSQGLEKISTLFTHWVHLQMGRSSHKLNHWRGMWFSWAVVGEWEGKNEAKRATSRLVMAVKALIHPHSTSAVWGG